MNESMQEGEEVMLSGIILAGGDNGRMGGESKAFLMFGEEALIQRQVRIMKRICSEIVIVTNTPRPFLSKVDGSVRIITDYIPGKGPLSGMHAGLTLCRNSLAWIVGCDMPFISAEAAGMMLRQKREGVEAVLPWIQGRSYPLHGIYDQACARHIWTLLMNKDRETASLQKALLWEEAVEAQFAAERIDLRFVQMIKTHRDYEQALKRTQKIKMDSG